jgi:hypothetical protein
MKNFSKTTWLTILLIVALFVTGFFAYQWWQVKGELGKKIEENANLTTKVNELQAEIDRLKKEIEELGGTVQTKPIEEKSEITITTDKTEYKKGEKIKITIKNNSTEKTFGWWDYFNFFSVLEVLKYENGKWISLKGEVFVACPCEIASCETDLHELKPREIKETKWDQTLHWCEGRKEKAEKLKVGRYRFKIRYGNIEEVAKDIMVQGTKFAYSNEFVIK